jgi:hypothetical protein
MHSHEDIIRELDHDRSHCKRQIGEPTLYPEYRAVSGNSPPSQGGAPAEGYSAGGITHHCTKGEIMLLVVRKR